MLLFSYLNLSFALCLLLYSLSDRMKIAAKIGKTMMEVMMGSITVSGGTEIGKKDYKTSECLTVSHLRTINRPSTRITRIIVEH